MFKKLSILLFLVLSLFTISFSKAHATDLWGNQQSNIKTASGLGETDPRQMVAQVINILLGFLGIIAVVLILYAGFLWMTAGGSDENIKKAKNILSAAVIGLIIILMSYGIANMVLKELSNATNLAP
jgi:Type IV secretion system pilin